jgi:small subunit ribosomal protein S16
MLKIRLQRAGAKKRPFYRIVAIDERRQRDGRALEFLGTYDPKVDPGLIKLQLDRVDHWVGQGARLSDTVSSLVNRARKQAAAAPPEAS